MNNVEPVADAIPAPKRRPLFLVGVILFVLGLAIYVVQISLANLAMPWYLPMLSLAGVASMVVSVWQRRSAWRIAGLVLFVLLCGFECYVLLIASKTPLYTGPGQPGVQVPEFKTTLANGTPFTNADLDQAGPAVLVFFRGRW